MELAQTVAIVQYVRYLREKQRRADPPEKTQQLEFVARCLSGVRTEHVEQCFKDLGQVQLSGMFMNFTKEREGSKRTEYVSQFWVELLEKQDDLQAKFREISDHTTKPETWTATSQIFEGVIAGRLLKNITWIPMDVGPINYTGSTKVLLQSLEEFLRKRNDIVELKKLLRHLHREGEIRLLNLIEETQSNKVQYYQNIIIFCALIINTQENIAQSWTENQKPELQTIYDELTRIIQLLLDAGFQQFAEQDPAPVQPPEGSGEAVDSPVSPAAVPAAAQAVSSGASEGHSDATAQPAPQHPNPTSSEAGGMSSPLSLPQTASVDTAKQIFQESAVTDVGNMLINVTKYIKSQDEEKLEPRPYQVAKTLTLLGFQDVAELLTLCVTETEKTASFNKKHVIQLIRSIHSGSLDTFDQIYRTWALTTHPDKPENKDQSEKLELFQIVSSHAKFIRKLIDLCKESHKALISSSKAPDNSIPGHGEDPAQLSIREVAMNVVDGEAEVDPPLEADPDEPHGLRAHADVPELGVGEAHGLELLAGGLEPDDVCEVAVEVPDGVSGPVGEVDCVPGLAACVQDPEPDVGLELPELPGGHVPLDEPVEVDSVVLLDVPPAEGGLELGTPAVDPGALSGAQSDEHTTETQLPLYSESWSTLAHQAEVGVSTRDQCIRDGIGDLRALDRGQVSIKFDALGLMF